MTPIPALIVSGYLGSGKTTLVGHLLRHAQQEGVRLAIISNEFGDTGIDRALLDAGQEGFVELDGGCVCCKLSDALAETLEAILATAHPDRLVLETSGVALPAEVLVQFWRPPVEAWFREEVVVVLVDARTLAETQHLDDTFTQQVEAADVLLLNKTDLVDEAALRRCEDRLREMSGGQPVLRTLHANVDTRLLFPPDPTEQRTHRRDPEATVAPHHHERFTSRELVFGEITDVPAFLSEVQALGALRAKGFVQTPAGVRVVQGIGARIELVEPKVPVPPHLIGKVVLILADQGST